MQRIALTTILLACLTLLPAAPSEAWLFTDDTLVSIDGEKYSADDFKRWWKFWQEPEQPLPKSPTPYIDWLLLSLEANRMGLFNDPGFQRQTRVFVQSRGLLMLKYEAVDSKIDIAEKDIRAIYEERYLPRWQLQRMEFKDADAAESASKELAEGTVTLEDLLSRNAEEGGPVKADERWLRPEGIDPGWAALFNNLEVGEVVDPAEHGFDHVLYLLKEQKGGDDEDLATVRERIKKDLWKKQENALTRKLLTDLREEYRVKIDEERLEALDIGAPDDSFTDAAVITSAREDVSEKEFMAVIRRLMGSRPTAAHAAADLEEAAKLKVETAQNIIGQSVTNWASLDRHFEKEEPFKWEYEFNFNHRLVMALENRLFAPEAEEISEEEISRYYQENIERYSRPSVVKLYLIDETQGPVSRIWADVASGGNFVKVASKNFGIDARLQEIPANHLDPEVKAVVDKLVDGETSQVFNAQGIQVIAHLFERTPEAPLPLERVKDSIRSQLKKEKLTEVRNKYLNSLRANSDIEVKERQWKSIQKELGGA